MHLADLITSLIIKKLAIASSKHLSHVASPFFSFNLAFQNYLIHKMINEEVIGKSYSPSGGVVSRVVLVSLHSGQIIFYSFSGFTIHSSQ